MMLSRSWSLKPPVCSGVCDTSVKGPPVAVSPWQLVQAGPPDPCSRGLPVPPEAPLSTSEMPSLYRASPIIQFCVVLGEMMSCADPHFVPSTLWTTMVVVPAASVVRSTSLGRSMSAMMPTYVESALQTTLSLEPTTSAGTENVWTPSYAEYIGLKAT